MVAGYSTFDIFIFLIIIAGGLYGVYRGLVYTLLSFAGKILSAILAVSFLGKFIETFKIKDLFLRGITDIIRDYVPLSEEIKNIKLVNGEIDLVGSPLENNIFAKIMGDNISREIEHLYDIGEQLSLTTVGEMMALILANYIINILSFIALFLIFLIGFSILRSVLVKIVGTSDIITGLDKLLGVVFGAAINVFILAFVLGVSYDILNLITVKEDGFLEIYKEMINNSQLQTYLYQIYSLIINEGTKLL